MHGWETRMLLKHYLERGVSKTELSRRFGVSRRTIHEWIETRQLDRDLEGGGTRYRPRPAVGHKLDPYKGIIKERLEEFPRLSAKRLYDEVRAVIESLMEAKAAGELSRRLRVLTHPALLVVDEIGYLPVTQDGAVLFFQLINARHERASTVLTSNKGFEEWGSVLGDEVMAAALIDRLLHHCHIVNIRGNSYRIREHRNLLGPESEQTGQGVAL